MSKTIHIRWFIATIAGALLVMAIIGIIFIHNLGMLKEQEKAWRAEVDESKAKIKVLNDDIAAKQAHNEVLAAKVAALEPQIDSIISLVEEREVTILQTKNYGKKTIDTYLALPVDEREAAFAKLIGRR